MRIIRPILLLLLFASPVLAATASGPPDDLLIRGEGFTISLQEPPGWTADSTAHAAEHGSLVLYRDLRDAGGNRPSIRVLISDKVDERTEEDLKFDMEGYRKKFPGVKFRDLDITHPEYRAFPKLFYVENVFYEYVTYLNPGKSFRCIITISMHVQRTEAGADDLAAYAALVASVKAMK